MLVHGETYIGIWISANAYLRRGKMFKKDFLPSSCPFEYVNLQTGTFK